MAFAPIAALALSAVGGLAEAGALDAQARVARRQAAAAAERRRRETERQLSSLRARFGGGGVQLAGSAVDVLGEQAAEGELAALDELYAGDLKSWQLRQRASQKRFAAGASLLTQGPAALGFGS